MTSSRRRTFARRLSLALAGSCFSRVLILPDFSMPGGDDSAYMWKGKGLSTDYALHYGEGILEVMVPKDLYQLRLQGHERPYQGGPHIEVPVPHADFDVLNKSIRRWHT